MSYIEKEPIIEFITKGLNNPDKTKAFGYDAIEILTEIEYAPIADVVPKSENDRLEKLFNDMTQEAKGYLNRLYGTGIEVLENNLKNAESEIERLKQICHSYALQYGTVRDQRKVIDEIKADVAREIFEEIEEALFNNHCVDDGTDYPTPHYFEELKDDIAELKKKYTEGNDEMQHS